MEIETGFESEAIQDEESSKISGKGSLRLRYADELPEARQGAEKDDNGGIGDLLNMGKNVVDHVLCFFPKHWQEPTSMQQSHDGI